MERIYLLRCRLSVLQYCNENNVKNNVKINVKNTDQLMARGQENLLIPNLINKNSTCMVVFKIDYLFCKDIQVVPTVLY